MKPESEEEVMLSMEGLRGEGGEGQLVGGEQTPEGGGFKNNFRKECQSVRPFILHSLFWETFTFSKSG